jgi:hypothetical protein
MPFLIHPPTHYPHSYPLHHIYTILSPDDTDFRILRDLRDWDWHITWHEFTDTEFLEPLVHEDKEKRRRGSERNFTLDEVWEVEVRRRIDGTMKLWTVGEEGEDLEGAKLADLGPQGRKEDLALHEGLEEDVTGQQGGPEEFCMVEGEAQQGREVLDRRILAYRRGGMKQLTLEEMWGRKTKKDCDNTVGPYTVGTAEHQGQKMPEGVAATFQRYERQATVHDLQKLETKEDYNGRLAKWEREVNGVTLDDIEEREDKTEEYVSARASILMRI